MGKHDGKNVRSVCVSGLPFVTPLTLARVGAKAYAATRAAARDALLQPADHDGAAIHVRSCLTSPSPSPHPHPSLTLTLTRTLPTEHRTVVAPTISMLMVRCAIDLPLHRCVRAPRLSGWVRSRTRRPRAARIGFWLECSASRSLRSSSSFVRRFWSATGDRTREHDLLYSRAVFVPPFGPALLTCRVRPSIL
jgi:hypothetical protein